MDAGYLLSEPPPPGNCKCKGPGSWKLEEQGLSCQWRCKCRKTVAVTRREEDLFCGQRLALRLLAGALWVYTSNLHLSPDQTSVLLGVDARALRALFERFNHLFTPLIDQLNDSLVVGGCGMDVELDEVAFRSVGRPGGIIWLRYLAAARRGSSKIWLSRLPYRITQAGQGGGGPISIDEMNQALLLFSDEPVLGEGSVCHTDGAKAYKTLASPLYDGSLENYSLKLSHTCVRHKPPHPEFLKEMSVPVWSGSEFVEEIRIGGMQKLDGFFCEFPQTGRKEAVE